ncbi:hypothetical protein [Methylovulum psychrotolerans]|uniref:Uncharacterized protein n=1 Tax=Methylovulum psychrotolerans TaxID=1704499 RepID=A0A1Z4C056_9GAMM|nr:hypothetical protein [Methylovulum psychrotolerans]ASF46918.1 hypothetical protein CEK71_13030 [Methylovulum psychrotolerans]
MVFVNEAISEDDQRKLAAEVSYAGLKPRQWIPPFTRPYWWAIDRERGVYLFALNGKYYEQLPFYVLGIAGQTVVFSAERKSQGEFAKGIHCFYAIDELLIPASLEPRRDEIKQLICESLKEKTHFQPFANGGTADRPNTTDRITIFSFKVEFR